MQNQMRMQHLCVDSKFSKSQFSKSTPPIKLKNFFPHTPAESKFFLLLVFTKMLLSAKGMRKNSILTSGGNKECQKSQV